MMETLRATYIGEPVTAGGLALVGVEPRVTPIEADAVWRALVTARREADLVIVNQAHAALIEARLRDLLAVEPTPPVVVLPTLNSDEAATDRAVEPARRVLGLV